MYNLIKTRYMVIISVIMFTSYGLSQFYSEELGILVGISKKAISEIFFIMLMIIIFLIGFYLDKLRFNKVKETDYKIKHCRNPKMRVIFILLALVTLILYILVSINSTYPPFFFMGIIFLLLLDVFFGKAYINPKIIIISNKVLIIDKIEKAEIISNSFGNKLALTVEDGNRKTVDCISSELREYVLNIIEGINHI